MLKKIAADLVGLTAGVVAVLLAAQILNPVVLTFVALAVVFVALVIVPRWQEAGRTVDLLISEARDDEGSARILAIAVIGSALFAAPLVGALVVAFA